MKKLRVGGGRQAMSNVAAHHTQNGGKRQSGPRCGWIGFLLALGIRLRHACGWTADDAAPGNGARIDRKKGMTMSIGERVTADMKAAMIGKEQERLDALRLIRAELLKAEKEGTGSPDDDKQMAILQRMLKQRQESIEQFENAGRREMAEQERREMAVIRSYLPDSLSDAEIGAVVDSVLAEAGTPDPKQMGKLMGQVMGKLKASGKPFDGKMVNRLVRERLGG
jgi:uncharacterized protein YqeY